MLPDFRDIEYLSKGSEVQRAGYHALRDTGILQALADFDPVVVGTLPIDLFTDSSDIDIICEFADRSQFILKLKDALKAFERADVELTLLHGTEGVIASFHAHLFDFEIVGLPIPVTRQAAFIHLCNEWLILEKFGEEFRQRVLTLKKRGVKTEPAFAELLKLPGDPYVAMLHPGIE